MEKIVKILKQGGYLDAKHVKHLQQEYRVIKKALTKYGIQCGFSNDQAFFDLEIIYTSLLNKQTFESLYEKLKNELFEIWQYFEYNERKACIDHEMLQAKLATKYFYNANDKIIRIAFFDELLNALYENEMIIFDLPQYFKLEKVFADKMINVNTYQYRPFEAGYSSCQYLDHNESGYVIFNIYTKSIYVNYYQKGFFQLAFDKHKDLRHFTNETLQMIAKAILSEDEEAIVRSLIESHLCSVYIDHKLANYLHKLGKRVN